MDDTFESARRELCPDGSCIGLIGPDGRCRVCGTVAPSAVTDPRHRGMVARDEGGAVDPFEDERELCPDGACVGVIGPDGRCKECGAAAPERAAGSAGRAAATGRPAAPGGEPAAAAAPAGAGGEALEVDDEEDRELCPDGACIGLIGPDGRCKVCGTPRE